MNLIDELRMLTEDLHDIGYIRSSSAMLQAADEIECLRAKIAEMEKQVPICRAEDLRHAEILLPSLGLMPEDKLYALPGAQTQGEER